MNRRDLQTSGAIHTPHSVEGEMGVLGSMIIGGDAAIEECSAKITEDYFYVPAHGTVFNLLLAARASRIPTDLITFTQALRDDRPHGEDGASSLETVGGAAFVTSLFTVVPTAANLPYYLEIVREKFILRQLIARCTESIRRAYSDQDDVNALLEEHVSQTVEIGQMANFAQSIRHAGTFVAEAVANIEAIYHNRGKPIGLESGFVDLDRMTGGFQAPLTYYFAGRPAMGKSSVMVAIAEHIAIRNVEKNIPVGIFSIEMTGRQLVTRMICDRAGVNLQRARDGFLSREREDLAKIRAEAQAVVASKLFIDETSMLSILQFRALARQMVLTHKVQLIIIDYIQRMHSTSKRAQGNREQEMNEIAQGISATAKELNVPIIVLAQLNRKNEDRGDKVPQLSDLRESGSMEQEARFVALLHRPVYYALTDGQKRSAARKLKIFKLERNASSGDWEPVNDSTGEPEPDLERFDQYAEMIVAKQNEGPVGTVKLRFVKEFARFESEDPNRPLFSSNPDERQEL